MFLSVILYEGGGYMSYEEKDACTDFPWLDSLFLKSPCRRHICLYIILFVCVFILSQVPVETVASIVFFSNLSISLFLDN